MVNNFVELKKKLLNPQAKVNLSVTMEYVKTVINTYIIKPVTFSAVAFKQTYF